LGKFKKKLGNPKNKIGKLKKIEKFEIFWKI
jgi:hypothetical protein